MKTLGLYIHIPFCVKKCNYCDFYSVPNGDGKRKEHYLQALERQIDAYAMQCRSYLVTSVYIGGGTPSLLSGEQMQRLMKKVKSSFLLARNCEISCEINPQSADLQKLIAYRKSGINRLSIGMQSFSDDDLARCGRLHGSADNIAIFRDARRADFKNISVDIMYGLPQQSVAGMLETLGKAVSLSPDHISLYGLTVEDDTPFGKQRQTLGLPDEDSERAMYFTAARILKKAGYRHYEISNFSRKGNACRHNLKYWDCTEYLGLGPAAHSFFGGKRFSFKRDVGLYINSFLHPEKPSSIIDDMIDIPPHLMIAEYVMLRFRLSAGIDVKKFKKRFGRDFEEMYFDKLKPFLDSGHILQTKYGYAFSEEGMYVSNFILSRIIDFDVINPGA